MGWKSKWNSIKSGAASRVKSVGSGIAAIAEVGETLVEGTGKQLFNTGVAIGDISMAGVGGFTDALEDTGDLLEVGLNFAGATGGHLIGIAGTGLSIAADKLGDGMDAVRPPEDDSGLTAGLRAIIQGAEDGGDAMEDFAKDTLARAEKQHEALMLKGSQTPAKSELRKEQLGSAWDQLWTSQYGTTEDGIGAVSHAVTNTLPLAALSIFGGGVMPSERLEKDLFESTQQLEDRDSMTFGDITGMSEDIRSELQSSDETHVGLQELAETGVALGVPLALGKLGLLGGLWTRSPTGAVTTRVASKTGITAGTQALEQAVST